MYFWGALEGLNKCDTLEPDLTHIDKLRYVFYARGVSPTVTPELELETRDPQQADVALEDLSSVFKALSDPARLKILRLLADSALGRCCAEGVCGCDLEAVTQLSQPTVSHHMKLLQNASLVSAEKRGKWMFYTLNPQGFALARAALELS